MFSRSEFSLIADIARRSGLTKSRAAQTQIAFSVLLMIVGQASVVAVPFVFGRVVDALTLDGVVVGLTMVGAFFLVRFLNRLAVNLKDLLFDWATFDLIAQLYRSSFRHTLALPYQFFVEGSSGSVAKAWDRGVKSARSTIDALIYRFVPMTLTAVFALFMINRVFGWQLALFVSIAITAYILYVQWTVKTVRQHLKDANRHEDDIHRVAVDSFSSILSVKLFNGYGSSELRMREGLVGFRDSNRRVSLHSLIVGSGGALIVSAAMAGSLAYAFFQVRAGTISTGDFVALFTLISQLFMPVSGIGRAYRDIKASLIAFEKLQELLEREREVDDEPRRAIDLSDQKIRFEGVGFDYGSKAALKDISFVLKPGKKLALVGPSGSGKSTIAKLALRLNAPTRGMISPSCEDLTAWRQNFGMVGQDTALLNGTVRENIVFGLAEVTDEQVARAAAQARLDGFIERLPEGYHTVIGERGVKLSGGEAQRLAIARALVRDPAILVFDEATSNLDTAVEREIQANIDAISQGRTSLVIAHRLSTIVDADEILVIQAGQVVARGRHEDLLASSILYASLWHVQSTGSELEHED